MHLDVTHVNGKHEVVGLLLSAGLIQLTRYTQPRETYISLDSYCILFP